MLKYICLLYRNQWEYHKSSILSQWHETALLLFLLQTELTISVSQQILFHSSSSFGSFSLFRLKVRDKFIQYVQPTTCFFTTSTQYEVLHYVYNVTLYSRSNSKLELNHKPLRYTPYCTTYCTWYRTAARLGMHQDSSLFWYLLWVVECSSTRYQNKSFNVIKQCRKSSQVSRSPIVIPTLYSIQ